MDSEGLFPIVRRWWKLMLVGALVAGLIAFVFGSQMTKQYEAEARLLVGPISGDEAVLGASGTLTRSYAEIAVNRPTLEQAAQRTGLDVTVQELRKRTTVSANEVSRFLTIRFKDEDPERAALFLSRISRILVGYSANETKVQEALIDEIVSQPELAGASERTIARIRSSAEAVLTRNEAGRLTMIDPPEAPSDVVSPNLPLVTMLGFIVGILLVGVAAVAYESVRAAGRPAPRQRRQPARGAIYDDSVPLDVDDDRAFEQAVGAASERRGRTNGAAPRHAVPDVPSWIADPARRRSETRARRP